MDSYKKKIVFEAQEDKSSFDKLKKSISDLGLDFGDKIIEQLKRNQQLEYEINELKSQLKSLEGLTGDDAAKLRTELESEIKTRESELSGETEEDKRQKEKEAHDEQQVKFFSNLKSALISELVAVGNKWLTQLSQVFSDAWEELKTIGDYSRLSNARTRDLAFTYGFTGSQAYGYDTAMSMMGFESEEDLMYATQDEIARFRELFQKYSEWHEDIGSNEMNIYREFQIEMEEFNKDFRLNVAEFYMKYKDEIGAFIEFMFEVGDVVMSSLSWLVKFFGGEKNRDASERSADAAEIVSNWVNNQGNSANFNNTFNINSNQPGQNVANDILIQVQRVFSF